MAMKMDTDTSVIETAMTIGELGEGDGLGVTDTVGINNIINLITKWLSYTNSNIIRFIKIKVKVCT